MKAGHVWSFIRTSSVSRTYFHGRKFTSNKQIILWSDLFAFKEKLFFPLLCLLFIIDIQRKYSLTIMAGTWQLTQSFEWTNRLLTQLQQYLIVSWWYGTEPNGKKIMLIKQQQKVMGLNVSWHPMRVCHNLHYACEYSFLTCITSLFHEKQGCTLHAKRLCPVEKC